MIPTHYVYSGSVQREAWNKMPSDRRKQMRALKAQSQSASCCINYYTRSQIDVELGRYFKVCRSCGKELIYN